MKTKLIIFVAYCLSVINLNAQPEKVLRSGPMLGYAEMLESVIWVQTISEAKVYATYAPVAKPEMIRHTNTVFTNRQEAFTAHLIADSVEPGQRYTYTIWVNEEAVRLPYPTEFQTQAIWKWRGNPPAFRMLTGSCAYINQAEHDRPGNPYGGDYRIFKNMAKHQADLMLWLGDNIYLREPDWNSWTGITKRYTHGRSLPELGSLLANVHNYAIWDDHDFGPNDSDKGFYNKQQTLDAFKLFWGNPTYGVGDITGAITSFQWGDADFFLLDNRWHRDPDNLKKDHKTMLGKEQLEWLFDNLVYSTNTFKIIALGGQFLNPAPYFETYSNNGFAEERQQIIDFICQHNIKNVIFITGDVHFTEMSVLRQEGKPTIWDLTFSTMTAGANRDGGNWPNTLRVEGTVVTDRNFGEIDFTGPTNNRQLKVRCYDTDNHLRWERTITPE
ncbi:MAG: alkaline phosphatase family protein [Bacteroidales bacterium]|nr:alkaline phosphatase family protein [Bacteroidales bacterium]